MSNFFKNGNSEHKHGKICVTLRAALEDAYLAFVRHPRRVRSASRALSSAAAATVVVLDGEESRSSFYLLTQSFTVSLST